MIIHLPAPAAATVGRVESDAETVSVMFVIRDAAHRDRLFGLLRFAWDGGFAVEVQLLHSKGRPAKLPCDTESPGESDV